MLIRNYCKLFSMFAKFSLTLGRGYTELILIQSIRYCAYPFCNLASVVQAKLECTDGIKSSKAFLQNLQNNGGRFLDPS